MKLYVKLEGENIVGHDWDKEGIDNFFPCKFEEPSNIFDTKMLGYKYKVVAEEYIELTEEEFENHPLKKIKKAHDKINKLKTKGKNKLEVKEYKEVKNKLTDPLEMKIIDEIISKLENE